MRQALRQSGTTGKDDVESYSVSGVVRTKKGVYQVTVPYTVAFCMLGKDQLSSDQSR
jgi:hypothetical protein